jgi:hypothetical protein
MGRIESGSFGCHTYNRHAGLETIDVFGQVRGVRKTKVSYIPLRPDTRSPTTIDDKADLSEELGIRLAARS